MITAFRLTRTSEGAAYAHFSSLGSSCADIGANLLDGMYSGIYNDKLYHQSDLQAVLDRAFEAGAWVLREPKSPANQPGRIDPPPLALALLLLLPLDTPQRPTRERAVLCLRCAGVEKLIITAGSLEEARAALQLARTHGRHCSSSACRETPALLCLLL